MNRSHRTIRHRIPKCRNKPHSFEGWAMHTNQFGTGWTPERVEKLKELWPQGLSCSRIGLKIGVSRSAVIGKAHRLKLAPRRTVDRTKSSAAPKLGRCAPAPAVESIPDVPPSERVLMMDLKP